MVKINCGDGTLLGDLRAAAKLAIMDNKLNAAKLYTSSADRIAELERVLDDVIAAHELPGDHCEMEQAVANAQNLLNQK